MTGSVIQEKYRKGCGHGVSFDTPCIECEIIWHREMLAISEADAARHRMKLAELDHQKAQG